MSKTTRVHRIDVGPFYYFLPDSKARGDVVYIRVFRHSGHGEYCHLSVLNHDRASSNTLRQRVRRELVNDLTNLQMSLEMSNE